MLENKLVLLVLEEERSSGPDQQQRKQTSPWEAVESRSQANLSNLSEVSQANPALPNCLGMHQPPQVVLSAGVTGNLKSIFSSQKS